MEIGSNASGDWKPVASLDALRFRAAALRAIREFFHDRNVLEVETPLLSATGAVDQWIDSFQVRSSTRPFDVRKTLPSA